MKILLTILLLLGGLIALGQVNPKSTYVSGFYKSNGTYVSGYYRTIKNSTINDNYSTYPNINPYTGKAGWITPTSSTSQKYNYTSSSSRYNLDYQYKSNGNQPYQLPLISESYSKIQKVYTSSPILSSPNSNGIVIARVENNEIYILEDYNEFYCKVKLGNVAGYMSKFYFAKENLYTKESSTLKYSQNITKKEPLQIQKVYIHHLQF